MNKIFFTLLFLIYSSFSYSQIENFSGKWTNGFVIFWSSTYNDSIVLFEGGDLHEGGSIFSVVLKSDKSNIIYGRHPESLRNPSIGEVGNNVILSETNGEKFILIENSEGNIADFLISLQYQTLEEIIISNKINHELAGVYVDNESGEKITFLPNEKTVKGLVENHIQYSFGYEYDAPVEVITLNGQSFFYKLTETGLEIYNAETNQHDDWVKKEKIKTLEKIEWFNLSGNVNIKGKYQFASTQLLIDGILYNYTPFQLKIMRNEIFARHGYIFKTDKMREYFKKQDWYKPDNGNINDKLTEVERLNILLIKRYEKEEW